jgi:hypothetical protein
LVKFERKAVHRLRRVARFRRHHDYPVGKATEFIPDAFQAPSADGIIVSKSLPEAGYQEPLHCVGLYQLHDRGVDRRRTQLLIACKRPG